MTMVIRIDRRGTLDLLRFGNQTAIALLAGVSVALLLAYAVASQGKTMAVMVGGLFALGCWPILAAFPGYLEKSLLAALAATLSVSLKFHLAYKSDHFGGAIGYRVSITELLVGVILLCAVWGMSRAHRVEIRIDKAVFRAFGAYLLLAAFSAFTSDGLQVGLYQLSALLTSFLLFVFLCNYLDSRVRIRIFVTGLLLGIVLQSAAAMVQVKSPGTLSLNFLGAAEEAEAEQADGNIDLPDVDLGTTTVGGEITHRPTGLLIHPNLLALYLVLMIPVSLAVWLAGGHKWMEWLGFGALCLGSATLYLTLSRSGWAGLLCALALAAVYGIKGRLPRFARAKKTMLILICAVALAGLAAKANKIYLRLTETSSEAVEFRVNLAKAALAMLADHPALGVGLNNFINHVEEYDASGMSRIKKYPVHNIVLMEFSETGFLGGIAFLVLVVTLTLQTFRWSLSCNDPYYRMLGLLAACGLVGFWFAEMSEFVSRIPIMTSLFWCCIALIYAIRRVDREAAG
jgi:putative inorganic carbon (HCO3(-)) transporter